ncbi:MAG: PDZ domain-containing protein [Chitinophagaceae bacterium]
MKYIVNNFIFLAFFVLNIQSVHSQSTRATFGFSYQIKENDADKYVEILEVINNAGAQKAGLHTGDLLAEINANPVERLSNTKIGEIFAAAKKQGSITIKRKNEVAPLIITLKEIPTYICLSKSCTDGQVKVLDVFNFLVYEGEFKDGNFNGKGSLTFSGTSKKYGPYHIIKQSGNFEKGIFVTGVTQYLNAKFEGKTITGVPDGEGIYTENGGTIFRGVFADGYLMEGVMITLEKNGSSKETKVVRGQLIKK